MLLTTVKYGLEKLNADVAAWMRGDCTCDGSHAAPPYLAMGDASSVMWNRQVLRVTCLQLCDMVGTDILCGVVCIDAGRPHGRGVLATCVPRC